MAVIRAQQTAIPAEASAAKAALRISHDTGMSVRLPAPFLVDRISPNACLVSDVFCHEGRRKHHLEQILVELQVNSNSYTDRRFVDVPCISVERAPWSGVLLIKVSGVVNEAQWEGLSARVNFIRGKTEDELNRHMLRILNQDIPKELAPSCSCSKGAGVGMLIVAMMARGGITAELGESIEHGLNRFSLDIGFMMETQGPKL